MYKPLAFSLALSYSFCVPTASKAFQFEDFELAAQGYAAKVVFAVKENTFLNTHNAEAPALEQAGDYLLTPVRYLFHGKDYNGDEITPSCTYEKSTIKSKTLASIIALPTSLVTGSLLKGLSYLLSPRTRAFQEALKAKAPHAIETKTALYKSLGIPQLFSSHFAPCLHLPRGPFVYPQVTHDIKALQQIAHYLSLGSVPYWLDDGTCLGAYRHGGVIPWDYDIDLAILEPDFDNAKAALSGLDPTLYSVQDWSGALCPKTYLRVFVHKTMTLIDIYCYRIDSEKRTVRYLYALEDSPYVAQKWKDRERHLMVDIPYEKLFPLKKIFFEGFEVNVPGSVEEWLHEKYGENLAPARLWDSLLEEYVKDECHPYWNQSPI